MKPHGIVDAYKKVGTKHERDVLANNLMALIIRNPISEYWNLQSEPLEEERWKDILGFEGEYKISSWGRLKKIGHFKNEISTKDRISYYRSNSGKNYPHTRIGSRRVYVQVLIHVEVAKAFVPNPDNLPIVNHKDGDKNNAYYKNLEWTTVPDNNKHARYTGLNSNIGSGNSNSKITEEQAQCIFNSDKIQYDLSKEFGITETAVSCIKRGVTWSHVTGKKFKAKRIKKELAVEIFNDVGLTYRELSVKYEVPESTVGNIKRGLTFSDATNARFLPSASAKTTGNSYYLGATKVIQIFKAKESNEAIAKKFGVSITTVIRIKKGERWADVTKNI